MWRMRVGRLQVRFRSTAAAAPVFVHAALSRINQGVDDFLGTWKISELAPDYRWQAAAERGKTRQTAKLPGPESHRLGGSRPPSWVLGQAVDSDGPEGELLP